MVENEFVVVGVEPNVGGPPYALLAREEDGQLVYAGSAFVTLHTKNRDQFWKKAEALAVSHPVLRDIKRRKVNFLKPEMRVRARHLRGETMLRHASLTECRHDIAPSPTATGLSLVQLPERELARVPPSSAAHTAFEMLIPIHCVSPRLQIAARK